MFILIRKLTLNNILNDTSCSISLKLYFLSRSTRKSTQKLHRSFHTRISVRSRFMSAVGFFSRRVFHAAAPLSKSSATADSTTTASNISHNRRSSLRTPTLHFQILLNALLALHGQCFSVSTSDTIERKPLWSIAVLSSGIVIQG